MLKLIKKLSFFLAILVMIKLPFLWFYKDEAEFRFEKLAEQEFNTVFIGSSRTQFSVIPAYFDSLTNGETKSYNFGIEGGLPPRTFDWAEEVIERKPSVKYIFFELSGGIESLPFYKEPWRNFSLSQYIIGVQSLSFEQLVEYHDRLTKNFFQPTLQPNYPSYNIALEKVFEKNELTAKRNVSQKELELCLRRNLEVENSVSSASVNERYIRKINSLIETAEKRNVKVYFFIPPRLETEKELKTVSPIYQKLVEKYKFRAAHFDESLYTEETSIDDFHLSHKGAMIFSEKLADEFKER